MEIKDYSRLALPILYIKDNCTGSIRPYGTNHHDMLTIRSGQLVYINQQCMASSDDNELGKGKSSYSFVFNPQDIEDFKKSGAEKYGVMFGWDVGVKNVIIENPTKEQENKEKLIKAIYGEDADVSKFIIIS